ncbi:MAG: N-formylglutamate amidohydrolase [Ornithinibacter sp.]
MRDDGTPVYSVLGHLNGQVVATAIHTGHEVRADLAPLMVLDEVTRLREEDPFTDRIGAHLPIRVVVHRSRFEVDLNRDRESSVYREPDDCWGLDVWRDPPLGEEHVQQSRRIHDAFYEELGRLLDVVAARGPFVLYDVHSYNHRRDGADGPDEPWQDNPEVNVGTGSLDREHFAPVVEAFVAALSSREVDGRVLDVRENVKFKGAHLARWVHQRYPGVGCALALEFKKTFMDEWTGELDEGRVDALAEALAGTVDPVLAALAMLTRSGPRERAVDADRHR